MCSLVSSSHPDGRHGLAKVNNQGPDMHGASVTVQQVESEGESIGDVILAQSAKRNADLIVLGARSHARSTEILIGGVTRTMLAKSALPMLMSR